MGSLGNEAKKPWIRTPCIPSAPLSRAAGCNIFLKLENLQPSGSFKSRGVGNLMARAAASSPSANVHFYCSSGGNAGLACATSAISLNRGATIVVPMSTSPLMVGKLRVLGADVHQIGANWGEADRYLREELLSKDPEGIYVPPFDHPYIWDGAASIVDELVDDLDVDVDGLVCSVGGGGLLNGLMQGVEFHHWAKGKYPQVMAVETKGADSLNASLKLGQHVALPKVDSIATSLGAPRVSEKTWEWCQSPHVKSVVVTDAEAAIGCVRFADDSRFIVEAACGATIAVAYNGFLRKQLGAGLSDDEWRQKNVVLIVCGGSNITLSVLDEYRLKYMSGTA